MFFGVADRNVEDHAPRLGLLRLRQSTALIGATLLFCLSVGAADAQTLYYDYGNADNSGSATPDPQDGGFWGTGLSNDEWLRLQGNNNYSQANYSDDINNNNIDVVFEKVGNDNLIEVEVVNNVAPDDIEIKDGNFRFFATDDEDNQISAHELEIRAGASVDLDLLATIAPDSGTSSTGLITVHEGDAANGIADATLTLSHVELRANIENYGDIIVNEQVRLGVPSAQNSARNYASGSITASDGGNKSLRYTSNFTNAGLLSGAADGSRLTLVASGVTLPTIILESTTQFSGNVVIQGRIENSANFDLAYVPDFYGNFINNVGAEVTASGTVLGRGNSFVNDGTLTVSGSMTGLSSVTNSNALEVTSSGTLAATTITHNSGSFVSVGTLRGEVESEADATISGEIVGTYTIANDSTTSVGSALTISGAAPDGVLTVEDGRLEVNDGVVLTVRELVNQDTVDFSIGVPPAPAVPLGVTVAGNMSSSGTIIGKANITGDLTLTGSGGNFAGAELNVVGALINDQTNLISINSLSTINRSRLINDGRLNVNSATNGPITNRADSELRIGAIVTGNVTNRGTMTLASDIVGQLTIGAGGTTTVTGTSTVGGPTGLALNVEQGGRLDVADGNLTAAVVNANGRVTIDDDNTLTAQQLLISGAGIVNPGDVDNSSLIQGTLIGTAEVLQGGALTLDGATITGELLNRGTITTATSTAAIIRLQDEFVNFGTATIGTNTRRAEITGAIRNRPGGTAIIHGDVVAGGGVAGVVVNAGNLTLNGNAAGVVNNTGILDMTGNMARLVNSNQATVNGTVSGNVVNTGTLTLAGNVIGGISNDGTSTNAVLNVGGALTTASLDNTSGTVNVLQGNTLTLNDNQLTNGTDAVLDISGTVQGAAGGALNLQNQQGGTLSVRGTGTVRGAVTNQGNATIAGHVTGAVQNNTASGDLDLAGTAQVDGALTNSDGATTTVLNGADVEVIGGTTNNNATLNVNGGLTSDVLNQGANGNVVIGANGVITGNLTNEVDATVTSSGRVNGNVVNSGDFVLSGVSIVNGDFTHNANANLTQNANGSELVVLGDFYNGGIIDAGNFANQTMTIRAVNYVVTGPTVLGDGVIIDATIENGDVLRIVRDRTLYNDLNNRAGALAYVLADVTVAPGEVVNVNNRGTFTVSNGGTMTGLTNVINSNSFTIARGSRVQAESFANNAGTATVHGRLESDVTNAFGANVILTGTIGGDLDNSGEASLAGTITGALNNEINGANRGDVTVTGNLNVGEVNNAGDMLVNEGATLSSTGTITNEASGIFTANGAVNGDLRNDGNMTLNGVVTGDLNNTNIAAVNNNLTGNITNSGTLTTDGIVTGNVTNTGTATLNDRITGQLVNNGANAEIEIADRLVVGSVDNRAGELLVGTGRTLDVAGTLLNEGSGRLVIQGDVITRNGNLVNRSSEAMVMAAGSTLTGNLQNEATVNLAGTIDGNVLNQGVMNAAGSITGTLTNDGAIFRTSGNLRVGGLIVNQRRPLDGEAPQPGQPQLGPGDPSLLTVSTDTTLTAVSGLQNLAQSTVVVNGDLVGNVVNMGLFDLNNRLAGSLTTGGTAQLQGEITGNVIYRAGGIATMTGDLTVGGTFDSSDDFTVAAGQTLDVGTFLNRADTATNQHVLTVGGTINGNVVNHSTLVAHDGASIGGTVNNGTIDLAQNNTAGDELTVNGGLSGNGTYALDLDLLGDGGNGVSDRVVVTGGAATGNYILAFDSVQDVGPTDRSRRILVFDVDESFGSENTFTFTPTGLPAPSERVIYSIVQDGQYGNLYMTDGLNPAYGAISGNIALTQSLIGSVVNRPSSPFVPGLAVDPGEKPCGPGAWARAVAGRASADGSTSNGLNAVASTIEASYRGMQFGGDLACFDGGFKGWNVAAGVIGGVNDGTTTQPVYGASNTGVEGVENTISSVNDGEFRQIYGGIYLTASRERLSADLQIRRERTSFKINNTPTGDDSNGLQIDDSEFDSNATTISGSVSYSYQLPRKGWGFVPTAGFAFSNISTDTINFEDATLELQDSENRVGFVGGTLSRTFINEPKNSAIHAFGTVTVYKDFADDTTSTFTLFQDGVATRSEQLESSNLGVYGELSLGANYLKVLDQGSARAPRQFNASIRLDGRTGNVLDSYGVTAQVRLQF